MSELLSEEETRKRAIRSFLDNRGFKLFKEELDSLFDGIKAEIELRTSQSLKMDELEKLNFDLGYKSGLQRVLYVLEGFEEEAQ